MLTPEQALAGATILGARRLVPIHYGITGMQEYQEVDDPLGQLRQAAGNTPVLVEPLQAGAWLDWKD